MKRQLKRLIRQFLMRVFPFCLGLLFVGVQIGPSIAMGPTIAQAPNPSAATLPQTVSPSPPVTPSSIATESPTPKAVPVSSPDEPVSPPDAQIDIEQTQRSAEEQQRFEQFVEADQLYKTGAVEAAAVIYRQLKPSFDGMTRVALRAPATSNIEQMPIAAQVYWREAIAGRSANIETRTLVPLKLLVQQYPEFIPGHVWLAQSYVDYGQPEQALDVLQAASSRYPDNVVLLRRRITALAQEQKWIEAAIAARQFALLNPEHPEAKALEQIANEQLQLYRQQLKRKLTGNVIGNVLTGALGYALTGSLFGPLNSLQTSLLLLKGESAIGESVARQAKEALPVITDPEINQYVSEIGMKLAAVAGREDFQYEFVVIQDEDLNAFALPGGKVFINSGAIAKTNSEAELAGLLGHEISHAVLAHGLQLMTQSGLTANITQFIPYVGGLAESVINFSYSRDMEYQADAVGTRLLVSAGYAADGVWNLLQTLKREAATQVRMRPPAWLSTHPGSTDRLNRIEQLIIQDSYNRYAYEGVERHAAIQQKMVQLAEADTEPAANPDQTQQKSISPPPSNDPNSSSEPPPSAQPTKEIW
jgi:predicted Zn-dependent protease